MTRMLEKYLLSCRPELKVFSTITNTSEVKPLSIYRPLVLWMCLPSLSTTTTKMNLIRGLLRSDYTLHRKFLPKFYFFLRVLCLLYPLYFTVSPSPSGTMWLRVWGSTLRRPGGWSHRQQLVEHHTDKVVSWWVTWFCIWVAEALLYVTKCMASLDPRPSFRFYNG